MNSLGRGGEARRGRGLGVGSEAGGGQEKAYSQNTSENVDNYE